MRYLPNVISALRIACSGALLLTEPLSPLFFTIYALCGISDFLDGYIAKKMNYTSQTGAVLDSIADFIFFGVWLVMFIPLLNIHFWLAVWIGIIALIRLISLIVGFIKYRAIAFLHTYANKATGFAVFCFPFLYSLAGFDITAAILCGMAALSAAEELLINILSKDLSRDIKSILLS